MKSEHRHELKTNELAEWLGNFPNWAKENFRMIIYVSVVAIAVVAVWVFKWYDKNVQAVHQQVRFTNQINQVSNAKRQILHAYAGGQDISYQFIQIAESLQSQAGQLKDDRMSAWAYVEAGNALRTELHYRPELITTRQLKEQIDRSRSCYNKALGKSALYPLVSAAAKLGLGLCAEELGDYEAARPIYRDIVADANLAGTIPSAQAEFRLATMDDYKQKVTFKKAEEQSPAASPVMPQIMLNSD